MKFIHPAIFHHDDDGLWAEFPTLDGVFTQGDDLNDLMANAVESLELFVIDTLERGRTLPPFDDRKPIVCHESNSYVTLVQADVDLGKHAKSVKKTLTIPSWLNDRALDKGLNFSQVLQEALVQKVL